MKIQINPQFYEGSNSWYQKTQGVILVEKKEHIEPVWKVLCEQDDYWEDYKNLIKIAPLTIDNKTDLNCLCEYCGKTDIYDVDKVRKILAEQNIEFLIHQFLD